jgi:hypothetical protein
MTGIKLACDDSGFDIGDSVYFIVVSDNKPYITHWIIEEVLKSRIGYRYRITPNLESCHMLSGVGKDVADNGDRIECGKSISRDLKTALNRARRYFSEIAVELSQMMADIEE